MSQSPTAAPAFLHPSQLIAHSKSHAKRTKGSAAFYSAASNYMYYGFDNWGYVAICALEHLYSTARLDAFQATWCRELTMYRLLALLCDLLQSSGGGRSQYDYEKAWMKLIDKQLNRPAAQLYRGAV